MDKAYRGRDLERFYDLLGILQRYTNTRALKDCDGRMDWPRRGIYFFFEEGQDRDESGDGLRVVRVGTHALKPGSKTSLWNRLSQHRGQKRSGGGNHRGSIFRLLVGQALIARDSLQNAAWGQGNNAPREIKEQEVGIEKMVSQHIGNMPFLWLKVEDEAGPDSLRGVVERNSISLLSNYGNPALDVASDLWLGNFSNRTRVNLSGLWNQIHVDENYDPQFLDILETLIGKQ